VCCCLTYHGALNTILSILDCTLCMIFVLDGLAQPQSCIPLYVCIFFMLFIKHAPLQRSNTICFIVHLCYIFVVGDAVTNTINGFPLQLSLLHTFE
jgi:hypothetical protein